MPTTEIDAPVKAELGSQLLKEYAHPSSLHTYVRVLHGGNYLHPQNPLSKERLQSLPQRPHSVYGRLQNEWQRTREEITTPLTDWAAKAAKATIVLIESQEKPTEKLLRAAFAGWGIPMVDGSLLLQADEMRQGFEQAFFQQFCGQDKDTGMAHMAEKLIGAFAAANKVRLGEKDARALRQTEKNVLTVLEAMKEWLTRFYGSEAMQKAFATCVKAELATFADRFAKAKAEVILSAAIGEGERGVLLHIAQLPPTNEELPKEGTEAEAETIEKIDAINLAQPAPVQDDSPAPHDALESQIQTVAEASKEQIAEQLHEKKETYFGLRASLLTFYTTLVERENEAIDSEEVNKVGKLMGKAPIDILMALERIKGRNPQGYSGEIDRMIGESQFLQGIPLDFGIFATEALQDMIGAAAEVFDRLRMSERKAIFPRVDQAKLTEDQIRQLIFGYRERLPFNRFARDIYMGWVGTMSRLPTLGDQLYFLMSQDNQLAGLYDQIRKEILRRELTKVRGDEGQEDEPTDDTFIPPWLIGSPLDRKDNFMQ